MPVCFNCTAHSIDVFVVHSGGQATITKFVTEIDTTALEFCKLVIRSRLVWCFIAKDSSRPSEALASPDPAPAQDVVKIGTSVIEKAALSKPIGVKPVAPPQKLSALLRST
ncbi:hypothetical protein EVAR_89234_1 [Eumeta japonica]|uniref:Uncharacterized protein n=1 Tax=Eumeta variegata TaxID=151549 RepID=A0A4C1VKT1_EUMVA|nr:hypothetical protein EVAR_89234_1 [Eumeta japonica]